MTLKRTHDHPSVLLRGETHRVVVVQPVALPQGRVFLYVPYSLPRVRQEPRNFLFPEV